MKKCTRCSKTLPLSSFVKNWDNRQNKFYFKSECKDCGSNLWKAWNNSNPSWMKKYRKAYEKENIEKLKEWRKKRWNENKDRFQEEYKIWYNKNKDKRKIYNNEWHEKNREKVLPKASKRAELRRKDPILYKHDRKISLKKRLEERKTGHPRAIWIRVKNRLLAWNSIHGFKREQYLMENINCSKIFLREYLGLQFYKDKITGKQMSWENYPLWEIDHIIPLSKVAKLDNFKRRFANHFLNLRPLWKKDNLKKGARIETDYDIDFIIEKSKLLSQIKFNMYKHKKCLNDNYMNGLNPNKPKEKENAENAKKLAAMTLKKVFKFN